MFTAEFTEMFDVVIQLGAILAVVTVFFYKLNPFSARKTKEQKHNTCLLYTSETAMKSSRLEMERKQ